MEELSKIAKGGIIVFIGLMFSKIVGYIFRLIVARISVEDYGLFSLGDSIYRIVVVVSLLGLGAGVIRYVSYYNSLKEKGKIGEIIGTAVKLVLPFSIILGLLWFIFAPFLASNVFHNIRLVMVFRIFAVLVPFFALTRIFLVVTRAFQKIKYEVYAKHFTEGLVRIPVALVLVVLGYGLFGAMTGIILGVLVMFILGIYYFRKVFPFSIKGKFHPELIKFSYPLFLSGILWMVVLWTDTIMIGYFLDVDQVGIYNVAVPNAHLMGIVPLALLGLFLPITTALYAQKKDYSNIFKTVSKWIFMINFPFLLLMVIFSKQIIIIMFGKEYVSGALSLSILSIGFFIHFLFLTNRNIFMMLKKTRLLLFINLFVAILNIILNIVLIPRFGIKGGAIATSVSFLISVLIIWSFSKRVIKIKRIDWDYLRISLIGLLSVLVVYFISVLYLVDKVKIYVLIPMFILFLLFYFGMLALFKSIKQG